MSDNHHDYVRPQNAIAFEFDEFCDHMELAMAAGSPSAPALDPPPRGPVIVDENGQEMHFRFTDHPINRAMFAVKRSFNDSLKFMSFMWRFWALLDLVKEDGLRPWCQPCAEIEGAIIIPDEVLEVARRMRLNKRGAFNTAKFRRLVGQAPV